MTGGLDREIPEGGVVVGLDGEFHLGVVALHDRAGRIDGQTLGQLAELEMDILIEVLASLNPDRDRLRLALLDRCR